MTAAISPTPRNVALDALRGVAVLGIILMNVYVFALPQQAYLNPTAWGGEEPSATLVWALSFLFVEDKYRTLFAMLFGAGVAMLLAKDHPHRLRRHYARMVVLLLIGIGHAVLLANNDILRGYALAGLLLPLFVGLAPRSLLIVAIILVAMHVAVGVGMGGGTAAYQAQVRGNETARAEITAFAERNFGRDSAAVAASLANGRESFGHRVERRSARIGPTLRNVAGSIPINLAAMLVGITLWKIGLFAGQWSVGRLRKGAVMLGLLSLPPLAALIWAAMASSFSGLVIGTNALFLSEPFDLMLGIGYALAAMALFQSLRPENSAMKCLAATGRMALSNYLLTSIILAMIYASWGFGLFATLGRVETLGTALVPMAIILLWSPLWLSHFSNGPAEWLWRSLAQLKMLPIRISAK